MWGWFKKNVVYTDGTIDLEEVNEISGDEENGYVPSIFYVMKIHNTKKVVGHCDLRIGMNDELYYAGNIGYNVSLAHRGNGYAYHACKILFKIAKEKYMLESLLITCSPDNIASRKTLEKLDGTLIETIDVPSSHWLYQRGETVKNIYSYKL